MVSIQFDRIFNKGRGEEKAAATLVNHTVSVYRIFPRESAAREKKIICLEANPTASLANLPGAKAQPNENHVPENVRRTLCPKPTSCGVRRRRPQGHKAHAQAASPVVSIECK